jgi:hypothetical protein
VRSGVEKNNWVGLITRISDYRIVGSRLIATTAKLRNPKAPSVALGVPIEYSALHFFSLSFCYYAHVLLVICPGLENGTSVMIRFVI